MNVKTQRASRSYSRRLPVRVVIEIYNGCVSDIRATEPCEVIVVDRDEMAEEFLPDGDRGYASVWEAEVDPPGVDDAIRLTGFHSY